MAAVRVERDTPVQTTLGTTLRRLLPGDGVRSILLSTPSDVYLVLDDSLDEGGAVPATNRFLIPGGSQYPIRQPGPRPLLAAVSGTVDVTLLGQEAARGISGRDGLRVGR